VELVELRGPILSAQAGKSYLYIHALERINLFAKKNPIPPLRIGIAGEIW